MLLKVRHATTFTFDAPMRFVTQSHRLTPSACDGQKVVAWSVAAEGADFGAGFVDGAGDTVATMTVPGPVERIEVLVEGTVETTDTSGVLRGLRETISPRAYLRPTHATAPNGALIELKDRALAQPPDDELGRAHRLAAAVAEAIEYAPGATHAHTTAAEALEQGRGVCQDHAHALIAVAHAAGLPARYVTGYLLTRDDGEPDEASHAWAEIHVGGLGWVGFDPANRCCPDARYIRLGSGRDARAAAPIRGVSRGGGSETMEVSVTVASQQQHQQ
jgi:transglutaminase-like putative cysteine protease